MDYQPVVGDNGFVCCDAPHLYQNHSFILHKAKPLMRQKIRLFHIQKIESLFGKVHKMK